MKKERQEKKLPLWRVVLAILLTAAAAALLVYGSLMLTAKDSMSKKVINKTLAEMDLWAEYGEDVTKAVNIAISQMTSTPYQPDKYVDRDQLSKLINMSDVKKFIVDKAVQFSWAVTGVNTDKLPISEKTGQPVAQLKASEIAELFEPVRKYVKETYGIELSDKTIHAEIRKAINASYYESDDSIHFHTKAALVCVIVGALMLLGVYGAAWPRVNFATILCLICIAVLFVSLLAAGLIIRSMSTIGAVELFVGSGAYKTLIGRVSSLFIGRAFLSLLGCIAPIVLSIVYTHDRKHVKSIWRNPPAEERV